MEDTKKYFIWGWGRMTQDDRSILQLQLFPSLIESLNINSIAYINTNFCRSLITSYQGKLFAWSPIKLINEDPIVEDNKFNKFKEVKLPDGQPIKFATCNRTSTYTVSGNGILYEWTGLMQRPTVSSIPLYKKLLSPLQNIISSKSEKENSLSYLNTDDFKTYCTSNFNIIEFPNNIRIARVACGAAFTLASASDGNVFSWGDNSHAQLGLGHNISSNTPTLIDSLSSDPVTHLAAGFRHSLAITASGKLFSWGCGSMGQLGLGDKMDSFIPALFNLQTSSSINKSHSFLPADISCGYEHSLLLDCGGRVWSWGSNSKGQLGHFKDNYLIPQISLDYGRDVVSISAGAFHSACVTKDGSIYTWGANQFGQLGVGDLEDRNEPTIVTAMDNVGAIMVACGGDHTLAITVKFISLVEDYFVQTEEPAYGTRPSRKSTPCFTIETSTPIQPMLVFDENNGEPVRHRTASFLPKIYSPGGKTPDLDCMECIAEGHEKELISRPLNPNDFKIISPRPPQNNNFKPLTTPTIKNIILPVTPNYPPSPGFPRFSPPLSNRAASPNFLRGASPNKFRTSSPNIVRASSFADANTSKNQNKPSPTSNNKTFNTCKSIDVTQDTNSDSILNASSESPVSFVNPYIKETNSLSDFVVSLVDNNAKDIQISEFLTNVQPFTSAFKIENSSPLEPAKSSESCFQSFKRNSTVIEDTSNLAIRLHSNQTKRASQVLNNARRRSLMLGDDKNVATSVASTKRKSFFSNFFSEETPRPLNSNQYRPNNLPNKDIFEALKHEEEVKNLYSEFQAKLENDARERTNKKKALQLRYEIEQEEKKLQAKKQLEREQKIDDALQQWQKIIPEWENYKNSSLIKNLIWNIGVPPKIRSDIWPLAIENSLNITTELYDVFHQRAVAIRNNHTLAPKTFDSIHTVSLAVFGKEETMENIEVDLVRTFPMLAFFNEEGPMNDQLRTLLETYCFFRPDIGYVQGMSYLAGHLLLYMEPYPAFVCFANMLNNTFLIGFLKVDKEAMDKRYEIFDEVFENSLPAIFALFKEENVLNEMYLMEWFVTLFCKRLSLDVAIIKVISPRLLEQNFGQIMNILKNAPSTIKEEELFKAVSSIKLSSKVKTKLTQINRKAKKLY